MSTTEEPGGSSVFASIRSIEITQHSNAFVVRVRRAKIEDHNVRTILGLIVVDLSIGSGSCTLANHGTILE